MKLTYVSVHWLLPFALMSALMVYGRGNWAAPLEVGEQTVNVPHLNGSPLRVETANGSITVTKVNRADVRVVAKISALSDERLAAAKIVATRFGDNMLMVNCQWPGGQPKSQEACSFEVQIPDAAGVSLITENGNLCVSEFAGVADLLATNGNITVRHHAGPVRVATTNGTITISEAAGAVKAETSNGAISIALAPGSAGPIKASGVNAMIDLALGRSFVGSLSLSAMNGMVNVDPSINARVVSGDPHETQLDFGDADQKSSAVTINGMIHVTADSSLTAAE
jgi:hypothetical protein